MEAFESMVNIFLEMSKKVGVFMIISQTLMHLGIAKSYEKYIRLIISFMAAAQIIFSFAAFFQVENSGILECFKTDFQEEWKQELKAFDEKLQEIRENLNDKITMETQGDIHGEKESEQSEKIKITVSPIIVGDMGSGQVD